MYYALQPQLVMTSQKLLFDDNFVVFGDCFHNNFMIIVRKFRDQLSAFNENL